MITNSGILQPIRVERRHWKIRNNCKRKIGVYYKNFKFEELTKHKFVNSFELGIGEEKKYRVVDASKAERVLNQGLHIALSTAPKLIVIHQ